MRRLLTGLYGTLSALERIFFERFPFLVESPRARVVSIGNLTVGGTGKTPLLLELLGHPARPPRTAVLTRGYRSPWERGFYLLHGPGPHPELLTDEALQVNRAFPDVPLLIGKNRAHAARMAERLCSPDLLLLDDGFQYRRLRKDLELVLWDATVEPETADLLPVGRLREPFERLAVAGALILTRCELVDAATLARRHAFFAVRFPGLPRHEALTEAVVWITPDGRDVALSEGPREVFAFSAIARPDTFHRQLAAVGRTVVRSRSFRDHDRFSARRLTDVEAAAKSASSGAVPVCTEKDLVKIPPKTARDAGIWALRIRCRLRGPDPVPEWLTHSHSPTGSRNAAARVTGALRL